MSRVLRQFSKVPCWNHGQEYTFIILQALKVRQREMRELGDICESVMDQEQDQQWPPVYEGLTEPHLRVNALRRQKRETPGSLNG